MYFSGNFEKPQTGVTERWSNIRIETSGELTTGKTKIEFVGRCLWWHKGAESEKLEEISNG
jgi:hypothetical protein